MDDVRGGSRQRRNKLSGRLTAALLGLSGGWAVNDLSASFGYKGLAGVVAVLAVLSVTDWLRQFDYRAPLRRYASWLFVSGAGVAAVTALLSGRAQATYAVLAAAVMLLGAILLATGLHDAMDLLQQASAVGLGLTVLVSALRDQSAAGMPAQLLLGGSGLMLVAYALSTRWRRTHDPDLKLIRDLDHAMSRMSKDQLERLTDEFRKKPPPATGYSAPELIAHAVIGLLLLLAGSRQLFSGELLAGTAILGLAAAHWVAYAMLARRTPIVVRARQWLHSLVMPPHQSPIE